MTFTKLSNAARLASTVDSAAVRCNVASANMKLLATSLDVAMAAMPSGYKLVISRALGMHGIYCPQPSGAKRPPASVQYIPRALDITTSDMQDMMWGEPELTSLYEPPLRRDGLEEGTSSMVAV